MFSKSNSHLLILLSLIIFYLPLTYPLNFPKSSNKRRNLIQNLASCTIIPQISTASTIVATTTSLSPLTSNAASYNAFKTPDGIECIEFVDPPTSARTIKPGNYVQYSYTAYVQVGESGNLQKYDKVPTSLVKYGSGRWIRGLDEGIRGMRVGGRRRIIVPPKMGFAAGGGPVPSGWMERGKLNKLVEDMNKEGRGR